MNNNQVEKKEVIQVKNFHRCPVCGGEMELSGTYSTRFRYTCLACEKK